MFGGSEVSGSSNEFEHLSIVFENLRHELADAAGTRNTHELLQEQGGGTAILIVVCNGDREFRAIPPRQAARTKRATAISRSPASSSTERTSPT